MKKVTALCVAAYMLLLASPAGASDEVSACVADVMASYSWTETEVTRLQPRTIQIQGQSYPIRRGGTLELACREWAADKAILEAAQLRLEVAQLRADGEAQAETMGAMARTLNSLREELAKYRDGFWFEAYALELFLMNVFLVSFVVLGFFFIVYRRELNGFQRRMDDKLRRWRQNRRPPPINLMPPR